MNWMYKGREILSHDDLPLECNWFVYKIKYKDNTEYIGIKKIRTTLERLSLKNGKKRDNHIEFKNRNKNGKRVCNEITFANKPFTNYVGSSNENKGKEISSKEITHLCRNQRTATYLEAYYLFNNDAIFNSKLNNKNILGKFYDNALDGLIKE